MIDRAQIEEKARQIESAVGETRESVQNTAVTAAVGAVVLILLAFLIGRKRGKKGGARIEVYKV